MVEYGANVHLVAAELPPSLDPSISAELMDKQIKTTYVPAKAGRAARLASGVRFQFHSQRVEWIWPAIKTTRTVLQQYGKPILLTRAFPMASNLGGLLLSQRCQGLGCAFQRSVSSIRVAEPLVFPFCPSCQSSLGKAYLKKC